MQSVEKWESADLYFQASNPSLENQVREADRNIT